MSRVRDLGYNISRKWSSTNLQVPIIYTYSHWVNFIIIIGARAQRGPGLSQNSSPTVPILSNEPTILYFRYAVANIVSSYFPFCLECFPIFVIILPFHSLEFPNPGILKLHLYTVGSYRDQSFTVSIPVELDECFFMSQMS